MTADFIRDALSSQIPKRAIQAFSSISYFSITVLASSFSHMAFTLGARLGLVAFGEFDVDDLALADFADPPEPQPVQRVSDRFSLRIEDAVLQRHEYARFHVNFAQLANCDPTPSRG